MLQFWKCDGRNDQRTVLWNINFRVCAIFLYIFFYPEHQQQFFIHILDWVSIKMPFVVGGSGSVNNQQKSVCGENIKYIWQNGTTYIFVKMGKHIFGKIGQRIFGKMEQHVYLSKWENICLAKWDSVYLENWDKIYIWQKWDKIYICQNGTTYIEQNGTTYIWPNVFRHFIFSWYGICVHHTRAKSAFDDAVKVPFWKIMFPMSIIRWEIRKKVKHWN